ncbi:hypothetical protein EBZ80_14025, partial [bacterium]|nr:hypothetical protein [bacterium]
MLAQRALILALHPLPLLLLPSTSLLLLTMRLVRHERGTLLTLVFLLRGHDVKRMNESMMSFSDTKQVCKQARYKLRNCTVESRPNGASDCTTTQLGFVMSNGNTSVKDTSCVVVRDS